MPGTRRERRWPIPYLDLSNTLFFFFVALFAIALLAISDADENKKIDTTSKLIVHLVWPDNSFSDVDLSLKTPAGHVVWFRARQTDFASLDHDNIGSDNSKVIDANGEEISAPGRDEVIYVRQTLAGTYVVNVHLYSKRSAAEPVTVTLTSVEPSYRTVFTRSLTLRDKHEEHTAFRFTVDERGEVTGTDQNQELFINQMLNPAY